MARRADPAKASDRQRLSRWLRHHMAERRINAKALAAAIGETPFVVRSWASGRFGPPEGERLERLERYLGHPFEGVPNAISSGIMVPQFQGDLQAALKGVRDTVAERLGVAPESVVVTVSIQASPDA